MWLVVACPKADIYSDSMTEEDVAAHKLIAQFMSVSTKLEKYLQEVKPLTPLQLESISLTISGLHTFLDSWKRKMPKRKKSTDVKSLPTRGSKP